MQAFPFQSNYIGEDEYGNPLFDRAVGSDFFRSMWKLFFTEGVFAEPSDNFQVMADNGMDILVNPGTCFVRGVTGIDVEPTQISVDTTDNIRSRTDIVVLRVDFTQNRSLTVEYKKDTTSLRRDADIWELQLASINVRKLSTSILQSDITDTRMDTNKCGIVNSTVNQVDTTTIFNQYRDWFEATKSQSSTAIAQLMSEKESAFTLLYNTVYAWYVNARNDISKLQTFDFDNLSSLKGNTKKAVFNSDGSIMETIRITANGLLVASKKTEFENDGSIKVTNKVYSEDGSTIINQTVTTTSFNSDGSITEVII